jgi:HAD superfamily hydrolase (TIGR01509 family)
MLQMYIKNFQRTDEYMIKGAIFDLDGVLLDSMSIWEKAGEMFLSNLGIKAEPGLAKIMYCMSMSEGAAFLKKRYHLDMDEEKIIEGINHTIEDYYAYEVQLKEGVGQFLKDMNQSGMKMVIATSCDRQVFDRALGRLRIRDYFDKIFTSSETGSGKMKPDIYFAAAEYMGTNPKDTLVFEDALHAIQTAKSAGFLTVGVFDPSSEEDWEEIMRISDISLRKFNHFHDFMKKI